MNDKDCQVKPTDFEKVPKKEGWRKAHRRHQDHHHHITQGLPLVPQPPQARQSKVSTNGHNRAVNFVEELDIGPAAAAITHKSSLVNNKASRLDNNQVK